MIDENTRVNEDVDFDGDKEPLSDHLVGEGEKPELSPNPALSGYVKQENVSSLPVSPKADVLYILNGVPYRWLKAAIVEPGSNKVIVPAGWVRIGPAPNVKLNKGLHATPVEENQAPKVQPKVFTEPVHFLEGIKIKGKKLEDYIDSQGGVTEEEMHQYVPATIQVALVADKDIISQIDNDSGTIFPLGVKPLRVIDDNGDIYYLDYDGQTLVDEDGILYTTISFTEDGRIQIDESMEIVSLDYILCQISEDEEMSGFNSYKLYVPQGTQLFKHIISDDDFGPYVIISKSEEELQIIDDIRESLINNEIVCMYAIEDVGDESVEVTAKEDIILIDNYVSNYDIVGLSFYYFDGSSITHADYEFEFEFIDTITKL